MAPARPARVLRLALAGLAVLAAVCSAQAAPPYSDAALIDGFMKTVFGAEYESGPRSDDRVKKFDGPVRVFIDNRASRDRRADVAAFVKSLKGAIRGLDIRLVDHDIKANFRVIVVDKADYHDTFRKELQGWGWAPGRCLVRVVSEGAGIERSDAIIVSDGGETLFQRCVIEEILQGLGPVNDNSRLPDSVFNDRTSFAEFTAFDRAIVNLLYDRRVLSGMRRDAVTKVLPAVAADYQRRAARTVGTHEPAPALTGR